jgi:hypothetical protein
MRIQTLFGDASKDALMKAWFFPALALFFLHWGLYVWKLSSFIGHVNPLPMHYSVLVGIDKLLPWYWMLVAPLLATGVFVIDGMLAVRLWRRAARPLAVLLGGWILLMQVLFFVSTFLIVLLNVGTYWV